MAKQPTNAPPTITFTPAGFFAFRTPLLPIQELFAFSRGLTSASTDSAALSASLKEDRKTARLFLQERVTQPIIRDALFIASPSLEESLPFWLSAPEGERGAKVEKSLVRYFQRMSARPTPYGLFAGCSVGVIGQETKISVAPRSQYRRHTRLDMHYLCALTDVLTSDRALRKGFVYTPNSSLYLAAGRLRYIESRLEPQSRDRSYHLVSVEPSDYLMALLTKAKSGGRFDDFVEGLVSDEVTQEEAEDFVHSLIDSQIIVPQLEPPVTSQEPLFSVIENVKTHPESAPLIAPLEAVRAQISALDRGGLGASSGVYKEIAQTLKSLPAEVDLPRLLQVDMTKPAPEATLGKEIISEITKGLAILHKLARYSDPLREFKEKFSQRYEGKEVPLVEVLDEECGLGLGNSESAEASPLLVGLDFPGTPGDPSADPKDPYLLRLLQSAISEGRQEIVLTDKDIEALSAREPAALPGSLSVMASVAAPSQEALLAGDFQLFLQGASGPSGANLLGRFCHADPQLRSLVEAHLREEEKLTPNVILAEIAYLPYGRVGNVICRPRLRPFEIPYLGCSSSPTEEQIPVQDLLISVQGGRVRLRSRRLDRYVSPRMSNAHNFANADVSLYRFLCLLRNEGVIPGMSWSWGSLLSASFLPRVRYGRIVLEQASWRLRQPELEALQKAKGDQIFIEAQRLRARHKLPRMVLLSQFDNALPVDFDNVLSVESFASVIKELPEVVLQEICPSYEELVAQGEEGSFTHELVVPFLVTSPSKEEQKTSASPQNPQKKTTPSAVARSFAPGSSWLYAKLYTGTATADEVLCKVVRPVSTLAKELGAARWFFIRYSDPDWHVRFRIEGEPSLLWTKIAPLLYEHVSPLLESGQVWKSQLDTYEREIERYGSESMLLAEELFHFDSEAILSIVEKLSGDEGNDARWRLALRGLDLLLDDLGFDLAAKKKLLQSIRAGFAKEFRAEARLERQLDQKYRSERPSLLALFDPSQEAEHPLAPGFEILRHRSTQIAPIGQKLRALEREGKLSSTLEDLASSYLHMHANRLLRGAARAQELVLYDFLRRIYESQEARLRKGT